MGALHRVTQTAPDGGPIYVRTHEYDALGRETAQTVNLGSDSYRTTRAFDPVYGRVASQTYPVMGFEINYGYTAHGTLDRVSDASTGETYWELNELDADAYGLLAGLVGPNVMKYVGSSKVEVARAQLEDLAAGLDLFKLDVGRYPSSDEGLQVLVQGIGAIRGWNGPYLRKKRVPLDPWNNEYIYAIPGQGNDFDLLSLGADGELEGTGENADLSAWE